MCGGGGEGGGGQAGGQRRWLTEAVLCGRGAFCNAGRTEAVGLGGQLDHAVPRYTGRLEVTWSGHVQHSDPERGEHGNNIVSEQNGGVNL